MQRITQKEAFAQIISNGEGGSWAYIFIAEIKT